jgi:hypothetical protein
MVDAKESIRSTVSVVTKSFLWRLMNTNHKRGFVDSGSFRQPTYHGPNRHLTNRFAQANNIGHSFVVGTEALLDQKLVLNTILIIKREKMVN